MKIVGCDLHAKQQSIAMVDTETGEFTEKTIRYERESGTHCKPWRSITLCAEGEVCGLQPGRSLKETRGDVQGDAPFSLSLLDGNPNVLRVN